jgi:hypothetical protein
VPSPTTMPILLGLLVATSSTTLVLFLLLRFSERCCFLFFALCSFSALVFFQVA